MGSSSAVTVVLCTRDRPELLDDAVGSITASLQPGDELVVVDSASRNVQAADAARARGIRVIRTREPGLSRARNAGVAAAGNPLIAFTDDDCRPEVGWVDVLRTGFDDAAVGFVTGRVDADREGRLSVSCMVEDQPRRLGRGDDPFAFGVGANMAARRAAISQIDGFDERLGAGAALRAGEDVDLWWRLIEAGWEGAYTPSARVTHVQWRSEGRALGLSYGYGLGAGALSVKAIRSGRTGGWGLLRRRLWRDGLRRAGSDLASGYQAGAVASSLQAVGCAVGATRALTWR